MSKSWGKLYFSLIGVGGDVDDVEDLEDATGAVGASRDGLAVVVVVCRVDVDVVVFIVDMEESIELVVVHVWERVIYVESATAIIGYDAGPKGGRRRDGQGARTLRTTRAGEMKNGYRERG